jgi:diacylglycerol kinase family enzyme
MSDVGAKSAPRQQPSAVKGRVAVVYHPEKIDLSRTKRAVEKHTKTLGYAPALWLATTEEDKGAGQARDAVAQGATVIMVAGGDGTLREVIQAVYNQDVSISLLPLGTGNILARNLSLPLNALTQSVDRAINGSDRQLDLGRVTMHLEDGTVTEQIFVGLAGVGLDATIILNTDTALKRRIGWFAYVDAGLRSLPIKFERLQLTVDNRETRTLKVHMLLIGNCGFLPGNISVMPEAKLDDGILDVAAVGPRRIWNWVDLWGRVTVGNWLVRPVPGGRRMLEGTANVKTLENLNGKRIELKPERAVDIQLDGDAFGRVQLAVFDVLPGAMRFRC